MQFKFICLNLFKIRSYYCQTEFSLDILNLSHHKFLKNAI